MFFHFVQDVPHLLVDVVHVVVAPDLAISVYSSFLSLILADVPATLLPLHAAEEPQLLLADQREVVQDAVRAFRLGWRTALTTLLCFPIHIV